MLVGSNNTLRLPIDRCVDGALHAHVHRIEKPLDVAEATHDVAERIAALGSPKALLLLLCCRSTRHCKVRWPLLPIWMGSKGSKGSKSSKGPHGLHGRLGWAPCMAG